jgi:hypothetical protein
MREEEGKAVQQEHDGRAVRPVLAVEDVGAADGGGAVVDVPGAVDGFHFLRSSENFCVSNMAAHLGGRGRVRPGM